MANPYEVPFGVVSAPTAETLPSLSRVRHRFRRPASGLEQCSLFSRSGECQRARSRDRTSQCEHRAQESKEEGKRDVGGADTDDEQEHQARAEPCRCPVEGREIKRTWPALSTSAGDCPPTGGSVLSAAHVPA
jgi:hypothetical protein